MSSRRRAMVSIPAVALSAAGLVFLTPTAAFAVTGRITSPEANATFTGYGTLNVAATLTRQVVNDGGAVNLGIQGPGDGSPHIVDTASGSDNELRYNFVTNRNSLTDSGRPAPNGDYTVTLTGAARDSRVFTLRVDPATPTGLTATATGERDITLRWNANPETDIAAYDLYTKDGTAVATDLSPSTTSYIHYFPDANYGGEHAYKVRARRWASQRRDTQLISGFSALASARLTEPTPTPEPTPEPTPQPTDPYEGPSEQPSTPPPSSGPGSSPQPSGGSSGGGGGSQPGGGGGGSRPGASPGSSYNGDTSTSGGGASANPAVIAAQQQRLAFGLQFKQFAPKLGAPKLPPQPQFAAAPIPEGTYSPSLPYGDQEVGELSFGEEGVARQVFDSFYENVLQGPKLWRSIAQALLLLLMAGHLRTWLRKSVE